MSQAIPLKAVLTDNGGGYRSRRFQAACQRLGLRHSYTKPYCPRTNGKAERFIQTLLREWAYRFRYELTEQRTALLLPYLSFYNHRRAHQGIGNLPPVSRLARLNNVSRIDS